ncbi:MAG: YIP1 family protein [Gemmatimonadota bacterium]|nr:YIP1 family protein [Gemmatimonadota bacterium]
MTATQQSFVQRMIGAAKLDVDTYEEVEHDESATSQAAIVVAIVAVCAAIGGAGAGGGGIIAGPISALLGWLLWSGVTYFIGTRVFKGVATWGELLRTLGFAQSPGVLLILGGMGFLGGLVSAAAGIWMLIAGLIGIRQALDVSTGEALITAFLGWLCFVAVAVVVAILFGVQAAMVSSVFGA